MRSPLLFTPLSVLGSFIFHHFASSQLGAVRKAQKCRGETALSPTLVIQLLTDAQFCFLRKRIETKQNTPSQTPKQHCFSSKWTLRRREGIDPVYPRALFVGWVLFVYPQENQHTQKTQDAQGILRLGDTCQ